MKAAVKLVAISRSSTERLARGHKACLLRQRAKECVAYCQMQACGICARSHIAETIHTGLPTSTIHEFMVFCHAKFDDLAERHPTFNYEYSKSSTGQSRSRSSVSCPYSKRQYACNMLHLLYIYISYIYLNLFAER